MFSGIQGAFQSMQSKFGVGGSYPIVSVKSNVDGYTYQVRDMADKQAAADLLARVRMKMKKLYLEICFGSILSL